jgi:hypothetical protein
VNPAEVRRCFGEACFRRLQSRCASQVTSEKQAEIGTFLQGGCLAYFSAVSSCEISAKLFQITRRHIPEDNGSYSLTTSDIRTANPTHGSSPQCLFLSSQHATSIQGKELLVPPDLHPEHIFSRLSATCNCPPYLDVFSSTHGLWWRDNDKHWNVDKTLLYVDDRVYWLRVSLISISPSRKCTG